MILPNEVIYHSDDIDRLPLRFTFLILKRITYIFICSVIFSGITICFGKFSHNKWSYHPGDNHPDRLYFMIGIANLIVILIMIIFLVGVLSILHMCIRDWYSEWKKNEIDRIIRQSV